MGLRQALKKGVSWGFAPKRWTGASQVKENAKLCKDLLQNLTELGNTNHTAQNSEPHAMRHPKIQVTLICLYLLLTFCFLGYSLYLFCETQLYLAGCVAIGISILVLSYGVRELVAYAQHRLGKNKIGRRELLKFTLKGFRA